MISCWMWFYSFHQTYAFWSASKIMELRFLLLDSQSEHIWWPLTMAKKLSLLFFTKSYLFGKLFCYKLWLARWILSKLSVTIYLTVDSSGDSSDDSGEFMNPRKRSSGFTTKLQIKPCHQCIGLKRTQLVMVSHCFCTWT